MSIFDFFGVVKAIINPTSSYKKMLDKMESDNEDIIGDRSHISDGVEPEQDFNGLVTDIMNDFDGDSDTEDCNAIIIDDVR